MNLLLKRDEVVSFRKDLRGLTLTCQAGAVWVTQPGDSRDHVLRAGDDFTVARKGTVALWASIPSLLDLRLPADMSSVRLAAQAKTGAARNARTMVEAGFQTVPPAPSVRRIPC